MCAQMAGGMGRQTEGWLPVGQDPWAPCLGEGSSSALILPCWGGLHERGGEVSCGLAKTARRSVPRPQATRAILSTLLSCGIHGIGQQWLCPRNSSWWLKEMCDTS